MMVALSGQWKPRMGELAQFLAMDSTTMTAAAKALEKRGFLSLDPDDQDARARKPKLTEVGRAVLSQALPLWKAEHGQLRESLGIEQAQDLHDKLWQIE